MRLPDLIIPALFAVIFFAGCQSADVDRLTREKEAAQHELDSLRQAYAELLSEKEKLKAGLDSLKVLKERLDFLARELGDVTADIETSHGDMEISFYPEKAPIHVYNFVTRAESGFYDGTRFHRIIEGFMIQGGDPISRTDDRERYGSGGSVAAIPHEFNDISHESGVLSMARPADKEAGAETQFFIMHGEAPRLDGEYTAFGRLISGRETLEAIATTETYGGDSPYRDQPTEDIIIEQITVHR